MDKKRWADYSDSDWSCDEETEGATTVSEAPEMYDHDDSVEGLSLPFYLKILNLPFKITEEEVIACLKIPVSEVSNLKLLYSKGGKKKFRGVAVFKVTNDFAGRLVRDVQGLVINDRKLSIEVLTEWNDQPAVPKARKLSLIHI